jgi:hypothetical protein
VDVVCHETVPENSGAVVCGVPRQKIQVEPAVVAGAENRLAIISTVRNVVSDAGKNDTGAAWHTSEVENTLNISHENASVPFTPPLRPTFPLSRFRVLGQMKTVPNFRVSPEGRGAQTVPGFPPLN